jgi:hypothetical protein
VRAKYELAIGMLKLPFIDLEAACCVDADTYVVRDDARPFEDWQRSVFASKLCHTGEGRCLWQN